MKKAFKIAAWTVILLLVICLLAIAALYLFADPNKLKPVITSEVKKRTGYELVFDGKLSWSLYPQIGVKAQHVTLAAPNNNKPFLDLKRVNIAIEPMQLLLGAKKVRGEVHISEIVFMNVRATSALVGLHWQDSALVLRPIQASFYGGSLSGNARGKDFAATPAWNWDVTLSHVDMQPFLLDANGANTYLKIGGTGQVRINASTMGFNSQEMMAHLNGAADFNVKNGTIQGMDLNYLLKTADALINKQELSSLPNVNQTQFDALTGTMVITNGLAQTNNLVLSAPIFKANGHGQYNLPTRAVDLNLLVASQDILKSQWELPVTIKGPLSKVVVALDTREINSIVAARELDKIKGKVKDQIKERLPGKAGEYLQNLIGT